MFITCIFFVLLRKIADGFNISRELQISIVVVTSLTVFGLIISNKAPQIIGPDIFTFLYIFFWLYYLIQINWHYSKCMGFSATSISFSLYCSILSYLFVLQIHLG